jgi:hypothetical protein
MAQANYVPTAICTRITGARAKASTSACAFPGMAGRAPIDALPDFEALIAPSSL